MMDKDGNKYKVEVDPYTCAQQSGSMDKKYIFYPSQRIKWTMAEVIAGNSYSRTVVTVVKGSDSVKNDIIQFDSLVTLMGQLYLHNYPVLITPV